MSGLISLKCAVRKPWVIFASVAVLAFVGWSIWSTIAVVEARDQHRIETQVGRAYLCEKINELPSKLGNLLILAERRRELIGPTTTTIPVKLSPKDVEELARLNDEITRLTNDLGEPINCQIASTGTTTTTRVAR